MTGTTTPTSPDSTYLGPIPGLARLLDNIQIEVPAVTQALVQMAVWNTIEDFFIRSTWRRELVYWTLSPGMTQVDFNPFSAEYLVAWVLNVNGLTRYRVVPPALLIDMENPLHAATRRGTALLALKPTSFAAVTGSDIAPELWSTWFEVIKSGTLARLYALPSKPWSSPQLSLFHGKAFRTGISQARGIADGNYNGSPGGRWTYPLFAHGRRKN